MYTNRYKATITLVGSAFLFMASLPFSATFIGGFIFSACSAALVGGMADWFAVTALFRRPLGISFRTAIIPRNRERILNDIADMVENQLLTKEHVKEQIARHNMALIVIDYLEHAGGRLNLHQMFRNLAADLFVRIKPRDMELVVETIVRRYVQPLNSGPVVTRAIRWSMDQGYDQKVIIFLLDEMIRCCQLPYFSKLLQEIIDKAKETYMGDQNHRKFAVWLLESGGMSTEILCDAALREIIRYLAALKEPQSSLWSICHEGLETLISKIENDSNTIELMDKMKQLLLQNIQIRKWISSLIYQSLDYLQNQSGESFVWQKRMDVQLDLFLDEFIRSNSQQDKADQFMKEALFILIDQYHQQIGTLVRENLNIYTDDKLVSFVETKVGDDLQMIRINGSVVGGLVGMILHAIHLVINSAGAL